VLRKHHAHLELPKVKVATIKLFHGFQRLHLEWWHFVEHKC
jgi:D-alanyl-D-alanine dipeptidase